ncbi:uncharacterized protein [Mytilus edulis]|uniref:uncharacterized protein n=1 Tax=Mytilus edulis TaxID=6550 RepID=UPI0039F06712
MEATILTIILSFIFHVVKSVTVVLAAKPYVQTGETVKLNCSSDFVPIGHVAEFLVNKVTFTNIRKHSSACFNSKLNKICVNGTCSCAQNRRSYVVFFQPDVKSRQVSFSCTMRFTGNDVKASNDVIVRIIDIPSPSVYINGDVPVISGTTVTFICTAAITSSRFHFIWNCGTIKNVNEMMSNETVVWTTAELRVNSSYDGTQCICSIRTRNVDFTVSDYVTLKVKNVPILNLNQEFFCNISETVALVCSASGELSMFGFERWIHSVDGKYIRSLHGIPGQNNSVLVIDDCTYEDDGDYTCSVWNKNGENILWANKTSYMHFTGPPVILSTTVEEMDTGQQIIAAFFTRSSLVFAKWQCNGVLLNHSIINQIPMMVQIYNKKISLLAYTSSISVSGKQCDRDDYSICLSNEHTRHCEKVYFNRGANSFNIFWVMCVLILCIVAVGILPMLVKILRTQFNTASQSIQLGEINNSTIDGRYLQVYESDHIATHQYDAASRPYIDIVSSNSTRGDEIALGPYIDPLPCRSSRAYETSSRPYSELVPYQSSRGYDITSPEYLDVQPDTDTNSSQSDQYEKVD